MGLNMAFVNAASKVHLQVGILESNCRCHQAHVVPAKGKMSEIMDGWELMLWIVLVQVGVTNSIFISFCFLLFFLYILSLLHLSVP